MTIGEIIILVVLNLILVIGILLLLKKNNKQDDSSLRMEINQNLTNMQDNIINRIKDVLEAQDKKIDLLINNFNRNMDKLEKSLNENTDVTYKQLQEIKDNVNKSINEMRDSNSKELDKIRDTVEEKLQKTLNERLTQSFASVSQNLSDVQKGLGEMRELASGVGDLKKVLSNVKTRGILGETQLGSILEAIMSHEQYDTNVITKKNSKDPVEFAIKFPSKSGGFVYMPIDSKFPLNKYQDVIDASEAADKDKRELAMKELRKTLISMAKDIQTKYIDPPNTTEFGVMFLPVEGLYAEVVGSGITEELLKEYKVNVAGPSTMAALLNSLQMGFKTMAIEKRTTEVWQVLGNVKTEFVKFKDALEATQKKINDAGDELDKLVGTRTKKLMKKLSDVEELPNIETKQIGEE